MGNTQANIIEDGYFSKEEELKYLEWSIASYFNRPEVTKVEIVAFDKIVRTLAKTHIALRQRSTPGGIKATEDHLNKLLKIAVEKNRTWEEEDTQDTYEVCQTAVGELEKVLDHAWDIGMGFEFSHPIWCRTHIIPSKNDTNGTWTLHNWRGTAESWCTSGLDLVAIGHITVTEGEL